MVRDRTLWLGPCVLFDKLFVREPFVLLLLWEAVCEVEWWRVGRLRYAFGNLFV